MLRLIIPAVAMTLLALPLNAQNDLSSADDFGRISLTPVVLENAKIPQYAKNAVKNKLQQIVTRNGMAGMSTSKRFVITANIETVDKVIVPSAPPMTTVEIQPTLYIGDIQTGNLYASYAYPSMKGVGAGDNKAYIAAVKRMNTSGSDIDQFITEGKNRIIEYYNSQIDFILEKAKSLADNESYDEAMEILIDVPEVCANAYKRAMEMISRIYQQKIDLEGATLLKQAERVWASTGNYDGAVEAADLLGQINPNAACIPEADQLSQAIAKRLKEIETREWNFEMQKYDFEVQKHNDEVAIRQSAINAAKEIGVAKAKQPITYNCKVYWW